MFSFFLKKKELQLEIKKLSEEIDHQKRENDLTVKEKIFKSDMVMQSTIKEITAEKERVVSQLKYQHGEEISKLKSEHAKAMSDAEIALSKSSYEKLSSALVDLHQNGDKNSQFIQNMALEMIKKAPKALPGNTQVAITGTMADLEQEG